MSGTSADAIDAALVDFSATQPKFVSTHSLPIPEKIRSCVHQLAISGYAEIETIRILDQEIAYYSCQLIEQLCTQANISKNDILAIGSHGQTIRHYPPTGKDSGYTLQVGDPNIIAQQTGITTIADFRRRDIAANGHGAPLAPAFHNQAFRSADQDRIIVNLGGIANITVLNQELVIGYDTGPANGLMDSWNQKHQQQPYDRDGAWAAGGTSNEALLLQLLKHPFLSLQAPKSTGREDFNLPWLEQQLAEFGQELSPQTVQSTLLKFTVESLAQAIEQQDSLAVSEVYICGGGAYNTELMMQLSKRLNPRLVGTTTQLGIPPDWVETAAFAWLAKQTLNYATGNLPSVTGAKQGVILGGIYPGEVNTNER